MMISDNQKPHADVRYPRAILVSCELPWDERGNLIEDFFRDEIRHFLKFGYRHIYIFGTAGEGYAVDTARFQRIVEVFFDETQATNVFPQVGIIGLSTVTVQERISTAYNVGFVVSRFRFPPGAHSMTKNSYVFSGYMSRSNGLRILALQFASSETYSGATIIGE